MLRVGSRGEVPGGFAPAQCEFRSSRRHDREPGAERGIPAGTGSIWRKSERFCRFYEGNPQKIIRFGKRRNFEHSLPKKVTTRKRSATSESSDDPQGNSLVVQVSGGTLTRRSSVAPPSNDKSDFGDKGSTQFLSGALALLFFLRSIRPVEPRQHEEQPSDQSHSSKLRVGRATLRGSDAAGLCTPVSRTSRNAIDVP